MPNLGEELASLDFEAMIGGPLNAVVRAQANSALTIDFIKTVGFTGASPQAGPGGGAAPPPNQPTMVSFTYSKDKTDPNTGTVTPQKYKLEVPILAMVPIPYIRVEEVLIEFNAKLTSVTYTETTKSQEFKADLGAKAGWGWGSASLNLSYSNKKSTTSGERVERTYTMLVRVKATQDELPAGLERLLAILEDQIKEKETT